LPELLERARDKNGHSVLTELNNIRGAIRKNVQWTKEVRGDEYVDTLLLAVRSYCDNTLQQRARRKNH
jgi:hypothetical protein